MVILLVLSEKEFNRYFVYAPIFGRLDRFYIVMVSTCLNIVARVRSRLSSICCYGTLPPAVVFLLYSALVLIIVMLCGIPLQLN